MATLDELYAKIVSDDAEKKAFAEVISTREGTAAYLTQQDCDATPEELAAFLRGKAGAGEMTDEDLEGAAGGAWGDWLISVLFVGVGCAIAAGISAFSNSDLMKEYENPYAHSEKEPYVTLCQ